MTFILDLGKPLCVTMPNVYGLKIFSHALINRLPKQFLNKIVLDTVTFFEYHVSNHLIKASLLP